MNSCSRRIITVFLLGVTCLGLPCIGTLGLTGCSRSIIYRMDIQQGNAISEDMVHALRVGMTKERVQEIFGTPTLQHSFNNDRWDYYYYFKSGATGKETEKRFTIYFKKGRVSSWN